MSKSFLYRQRFGYGMGDFACNLIWQVISLYLLYFYTDVMKLNAASIATMFVVCRIIDGIIDVLVGYAIDKTHSRWGKSRPWFLFGAISLASILPAMTDGRGARLKAHERAHSPRNMAKVPCFLGSYDSFSYSVEHGALHRQG